MITTDNDFIPGTEEIPQNVVAMETSSRNGSICIANGDEMLEEWGFSAGMKHASELMPALSAMFKNAGWAPDQIAHVYVSMGPGSFTGIRIAMSVARALHMATGAQLIGVPTLDVIAQNIPADANDVIVMLDAKRGQVFAAAYHRESDGTPLLLWGPELITPAKAIGRLLGTGIKQAHVMGEGIDYHRAAVERVAGVVLIDREFWVPRARSVHKLGRRSAAAQKFLRPEEMLPTYIRLAEAEEVWRKKHGLQI